MDRKIKVLVADDNAAFGMIITEFLEAQSDIEVTGRVENGEKLLK